VAFARSDNVTRKRSTYERADKSERDTGKFPGFAWVVFRSEKVGSIGKIHLMRELGIERTERMMVITHTDIERRE